MGSAPYDPHMLITLPNRVTGILLFNMIPNYFKKNYLNIGWGFAFLGFNVWRLIEVVRDRTSTTGAGCEGRQNY